MVPDSLCVRLCGQDELGFLFCYLRCSFLIGRLTGCASDNYALALISMLSQSCADQHFLVYCSDLNCAIFEFLSNFLPVFSHYLLLILLDILLSPVCLRSRMNHVRFDMSVDEHTMAGKAANDPCMDLG